MRAAVDAATIRPLSDLKPGDAAKVEDGMKRYYTVASISEPRPGHVGRVIDGVTVWAMAVIVTFNRPVPVQTVFGVHTQTEFEVVLDKLIRIHPGADAMPKAESFVTEPKRRKARQ